MTTKRSKVILWRFIFSHSEAKRRISLMDSSVVTLLQNDVKKNQRLTNGAKRKKKSKETCSFFGQMIAR